MNHNFWAVEQPVYFFPDTLHTKYCRRWLKTHRYHWLPVPFYWSFSTSLNRTFVFILFWGFLCSFHKCQQWRKGLGTFSIGSQTFVTTEHLYRFAFCLVLLSSKHFVISALPEEITSPEIRGVFPTLTWQKVLKTLCTLTKVLLWQLI